MSMSRKDYEAMATEFGVAMTTSHAEAEYGLWVGVQAFCWVAKRDDEKFEMARFKKWVEEVRDGVRGMDGKKRKKVAS